MLLMPLMLAAMLRCCYATPIDYAAAMMFAAVTLRFHADAAMPA